MNPYRDPAPNMPTVEESRTPPDGAWIAESLEGFVRHMPGDDTVRLLMHPRSLMALEMYLLSILCVTTRNADAMTYLAAGRPVTVRPDASMPVHGVRVKWETP